METMEKPGAAPLNMGYLSLRSSVVGKSKVSTTHCTASCNGWADPHQRPQSRNTGKSLTKLWWSPEEAARAGNEWAAELPRAE